MTAVLADLAMKSEAAMRLAAAFDAGEPLARLLTPVAKYRVCKRAPGMAAEAMECLGGSGYVETGPMARLFRQSPLNAIWEGSGNLIALDVLRAISREPGALAAFRDFLGQSAGRFAAYDAWIAALDPEGVSEASARHLVERMALAAQAAVMIGHDSPAAEAFVRLRLDAPAPGYGASDAAIDARAIVDGALAHA